MIGDWFADPQPLMVYTHQGVVSLDVGTREDAQTLLEFGWYGHDWCLKTEMTWQPAHTDWQQHPSIKPGTPAFDAIAAALVALTMTTGVTDLSEVDGDIPADIQAMLTAALKLHLPELVTASNQTAEEPI